MEIRKQIKDKAWWRNHNARWYIFEKNYLGSNSHQGGDEEYRGQWAGDKMNGYGVYKYTSGAIYSGEWKDGKHHGRVHFLNNLKRVYTNFQMALYMKVNFSIIKCMVRVIILTKTVLNLKVYYQLTNIQGIFEEGVY